MKLTKGLKIVGIILIVLLGIFIFLKSYSPLDVQCSPDITSIEVDKTEMIAFWKAYDEPDTAIRRQKLLDYLNNPNHGGIQTMQSRTFGSPEVFFERLKTHEAYYKSIRHISDTLAQLEFDGLKQYISRFQKDYPQLCVPKLVLTVGCITMGGTVGDKGMIVGTEFFSKGDTTVVDTSLGNYAGMRMSFKDIEPIQFHELMHVQQIKARGITLFDFLTGSAIPSDLLGKALMEGAADFVACHYTGWCEGRPNYVYGRTHEKELWEKFQKDIHSEEAVKDWLFDYEQEKDTPYDMGYVMGAFICESYYNQMEDKKQAIADILSWDYTNPMPFLEKSKYAEKFK